MAREEIASYINV